MPNGGILVETGEKEIFTASCYYNNGNAQSDPTTIPESPAQERIYLSAVGVRTPFLPSYKPGKDGVFSAGTTLYAMWVTTEYDFPYTESYVAFTMCTRYSRGNTGAGTAAEMRTIPISAWR